jgi:MFS transporter, DHA2 family, multidrug resistance protein
VSHVPAIQGLSDLKLAAVATRNEQSAREAFFLQHNGDAVLSHQMALGVLGQSRAQQGSSMAYFDVFSFSAAVAVLLVAFVLLMRRSVAEKGAHISGE